MKRIKNILTQAMLDVIAEAFEEDMKGYDYDYTLLPGISYRKISYVELAVYLDNISNVLTRDFAINDEMYKLIKSDKAMLINIGHDLASDFKIKLGEL